MDVEQAIRTRRSIRSYKNKPVADEQLRAVLEAARLAPSARNAQNWRFVVVRDKDTLGKLVDACKGQKFVGEAGAVIAACSTDPERVMSCGVPSGPVDLAIAVDHMTLRAAELGLGTCWIGAFLQDRVKQLLDIPDNVQVIQLMALGHPVEVPKPTARKTLDDIVCYEGWR